MDVPRGPGRPGVSQQPYGLDARTQSDDKHGRPGRKPADPWSPLQPTAETRFASSAAASLAAGVEVLHEAGKLADRARRALVILTKPMESDARLADAYARRARDFEAQQAHIDATFLRALEALPLPHDEVQRCAAQLFRSLAYEVSIGDWQRCRVPARFRQLLATPLPFNEAAVAHRQVSLIALIRQMPLEVRDGKASRGDLEGLQNAALFVAELRLAQLPAERHMQLQLRATALAHLMLRDLSQPIAPCMEAPLPGTQPGRTDAIDFRSAVWYTLSHLLNAQEMVALSTCALAYHGTECAHGFAGDALRDAMGVGIAHGLRVAFTASLLKDMRKELDPAVPASRRSAALTEFLVDGEFGQLTRAGFVEASNIVLQHLRHLPDGAARFKEVLAVIKKHLALLTPQTFRVWRAGLHAQFSDGNAAPSLLPYVAARQLYEAVYDGAHGEVPSALTTLRFFSAEMRYFKDHPCMSAAQKDAINQVIGKYAERYARARARAQGK